MRFKRVFTQEQLKEARKHPKIATISYKALKKVGLYKIETLRIKTKGLTLYPPKTSRLYKSGYLGQLKFELILSWYNDTLQSVAVTNVENLDNKKPGSSGYSAMATPHALAGNMQCLGGYEKGLRHCAQKGDLQGLIEFLLLSLETYNSRDTGGTHTFWLEKKETKRKAVDSKK